MGVELQATARAACLDGACTERALALLDGNGERAEVLDRMRAYYWLWGASRREANLAAARDLLERLVAGAPREDREHLVENVPLYRAIRDGTA